MCYLFISVSTFYCNSWYIKCMSQHMQICDEQHIASLSSTFCLLKLLKLFLSLQSQQWLPIFFFTNLLLVCTFLTICYVLFVTATANFQSLRVLPPPIFVNKILSIHRKILKGSFSFHCTNLLTTKRCLFCFITQFGFFLF